MHTIPYHPQYAEPCTFHSGLVEEMQAGSSVDGLKTVVVVVVAVVVDATYFVVLIVVLIVVVAVVLTVAVVMVVVVVVVLIVRFVVCAVGPQEGHGGSNDHSSSHPVPIVYEVE